MAFHPKSKYLDNVTSDIQSQIVTISGNSANTGAIQSEINAITGSPFVLDSRYTTLSTTAGLTGSLTSTISTKANDSAVVHNTGDESIAGIKTFSNNVIISGNLNVNGTQTIINTTSISAKDNQIVINAGEVSAGVTAGYAGIRVDRGSLLPYDFQFRESDDAFVIGVSGSAYQAVATREDSPSANGYARWNNSLNRFDSVSASVVSQDISGSLSTPYDLRYVNTSGDTMTGDLQMSAHIKSASINNQLAGITIIDGNAAPHTVVPTNIYFDKNITAYCNRWGTVSTSGGGVAGAFSSSELDILCSTGITQNTYVTTHTKTFPLIVEVTGLSIGSTNNGAFFPYIVAHGTTFTSLDIKMEVETTGQVGYQTAYNATSSGFNTLISGNVVVGGTLTKVRWTFSNPVSMTGFYLRGLGVLSKNNNNHMWSVTRGGDTMYGQLNVNTTYSGNISPFVVSSSANVTNLNADYLDGLQSSAFSLVSHNHGTFSTNKVLKAINSTTIGDSIITDNGTAITVAGTINVTGQNNTFGSGGTGLSNSTFILDGSSANDYGSQIRFNRNSVLKASLGHKSSILGGSSDDIILNVNAGNSFSAAVNGTDYLKVSATGVTVSNISGSTLTSTVASGTAPLSVASNTVVTNLNADLLDGLNASAFALTSHTHAASAITTGIISGARLGSGTTDATTFLRGDSSWQPISSLGGSAGGANTEIQYNNSGAFAGDANLTYDSTNKVLTIQGTLAFNDGTPSTALKISSSSIADYDSTSPSDTYIRAQSLTTGNFGSGGSIIIQSGQSDDGTSSVSIDANSTGSSQYYFTNSQFSSTRNGSFTGGTTPTTPNADQVLIGNGIIKAGTNLYIGSSPVGSNSSGTKTISTSSPTGGSAGDIWYVV